MQLKESQREISLKNNIIEESKNNIAELENNLKQSLNKSISTTKHETELQSIIDDLKSKLITFEAIIRSNKEEMYIVSSENINLKTDLKTLSNMEWTLRQEITNMIKEREGLDETLQFVKNKISHAALELQKSKTENMMLISKIEELNNENLSLKEIIGRTETENILMLRGIEKKEFEKSKIKEALDRAHFLLNANNSINEYLELSADKRVNYYSHTPVRNSFSVDYSPSKKKEIILQSSNTKINPYASPIDSFRLENRSVSRQDNENFTSLSKSISQRDSIVDRSLTRSCLGLKEGNSLSNVDGEGLSFLQTQLKSMITEKKRLEAEYTKLPIVIQKSPAIKRRKEYLEKQLDLIEKNIQSYTIRLSEFSK